eukprot:5156759-Prymnesium_polylepis.1
MNEVRVRLIVSLRRAATRDCYEWTWLRADTGDTCPATLCAVRSGAVALTSSSTRVCKWSVMATSSARSPNFCARESDAVHLSRASSFRDCWKEMCPSRPSANISLDFAPVARATESPSFAITSASSNTPSEWCAAARLLRRVARCCLRP